MTRRERQHKSVFKKEKNKTKELKNSILERQYERRNKLKRKVQPNRRTQR